MNEQFMVEKTSSIVVSTLRMVETRMQYTSTDDMFCDATRLLNSRDITISTSRV
jgi:hypothetical protein